MFLQSISFKSFTGLALLTLGFLAFSPVTASAQVTSSVTNGISNPYASNLNTYNSSNYNTASVANNSSNLSSVNSYGDVFNNIDTILSDPRSQIFINQALAFPGVNSNANSEALVADLASGNYQLIFNADLSRGGVVNALSDVSQEVEAACDAKVMDFNEFYSNSGMATYNSYLEYKESVCGNETAQEVALFREKVANLPVTQQYYAYNGTSTNLILVDFSKSDWNVSASSNLETVVVVSLNPNTSIVNVPAGVNLVNVNAVELVEARQDLESYLSGF